ERVLEASAPGGPPQLVETAARGGAAELRVLGERDSALHAVFVHLPQGVLALGARVAERHVELVRRGLRREAVEALAHGFALSVRPVEDGAAAADVLIVLL